jgi:hypothetical protein
VQAVCNEGDQNVSFDAILELMKDGRMAKSPLRLRRGSPRNGMAIAQEIAG